MPGTFHVEIVAPDHNVFSGEASRFQARGLNGMFEVLHNHAPMMAVLAVGPVVVVTPEGNRVSFAASGGFVQVLDNRVIMLAETAEPESEIDVERARQAEERARARIAEAESAEDRERAAAALERARSRLRVAMGQVGTRT